MQNATEEARAEDARLGRDLAEQTEARRIERMAAKPRGFVARRRASGKPKYRVARRKSPGKAKGKP